MVNSELILWPCASAHRILEHNGFNSVGDRGIFQKMTEYSFDPPSPGGNHGSTSYSIVYYFYCFRIKYSTSDLSKNY